MSRQKRALALALVLGFALTLFVSSAYVALEAHHLCTGEHCGTCERIGECRALLRGFALLVFLLSAGLALLTGKRGKHAANGLRMPVRTSLVSWKVRLNN